MANVLIGTIRAIRPKTLFLGLCPVLLGTALAYGQLPEITLRHGLFTLATLAIVVLLQSAANLVNDVKDFEQGIDGADRAGPERAVAQGWLTADQVKTLYRGAFALALGLALILALAVDIRLLGVGIVCALAAYAYTGGPFPLAYYGLGELLAWLFFGPVAVASCYYLYHQDIPQMVWGYSCVTGVIAAAVMAINNYRDRTTDAASGKTTFATLLSRPMALKVVQALIIAPIAVFAVVAGQQDKLGLTLFLAALMALIARRVMPGPSVDGPQLNRTLGETSRYGLMVTLMACVKILV